VCITLSLLCLQIFSTVLNTWPSFSLYLGVCVCVCVCVCARGREREWWMIEGERNRNVSFPGSFETLFQRRKILQLLLWDCKFLVQNIYVRFHPHWREYHALNTRASLALYDPLAYRLVSKLKLNSVVWVRERTIPTERPPLVGEVIANFLRIEAATWSAWRIPTAVFSVF
jgi:hypothetical protein